MSNYLASLRSDLEVHDGVNKYLPKLSVQTSKLKLDINFRDDLLPIGHHSGSKKLWPDPRIEFPQISETLMKTPKQKRFSINSSTLSKTNAMTSPRVSKRRETVMQPSETHIESADEPAKGTRELIMSPRFLLKSRSNSSSKRNAHAELNLQLDNY